MASKSFNNTIFDYMRVVFHRWVWIVLMIGLSVSVAYVWLYFYAPRKYRSEMIAMVWRSDSVDRTIKIKLAQEQIDTTIADIRNKLQVDRRLQHLAMNLRFILKQELALSGSFPTTSAEVNSAFERELASFKGDNKSRDYEIAPDGIISYAFETREWLHEKMGSPTSGQWNISLAECAAELDTQSLARILCPELRELNELQDQVIFEIFPVDRASEDRYTSALHTAYFPGDESKSPAEVRRAAVADLTSRLKAEHDKAGGGNFSTNAKVELLKEITSIPTLINARLYFGVDRFYNTQDDAFMFWVKRLKKGLEVGHVTSNKIIFKYFESYYRMDRPFDRNGKNVMAHLVLRAAFAMMDAEFRATRETSYERTLQNIRKQRQKVSTDLKELNLKIYQFDKLSSMQLSFLRTTPQVPSTSESDKVLPEHWDDPWRGMPQHSVHIQRMSQLNEQLQELDRTIADLESKISLLKQRIADPRNFTIAIPSREKIQQSDPPEVVALKKELALKLIHLRKLLEYNTERHPFVIKTKKEVEQIKSALHEYRLADTSVANQIEEQENPELAEWRKEKDALEQQLVGLKGAPDKGTPGKRGRIISQIESEKEKAKNAMRQQQDYRDMLDRRRRYTHSLRELEQREEQIKNNRQLFEDFKVTFKVHTRASIDRKHYEPKEPLILLMALLVGMLAAATVVFLQEYLDHSIKTTEDVKRHIGLPVLGTIPEFNFAEIEKAGRMSEKRRLSGLKHRGYPYPLPVDMNEPMPNRERAKVVSRKKLSNRAMLSLGLLAMGALCAFLFINWGGIYDYFFESDAAEKVENVNKTDEKTENTVNKTANP